MFERLGAVRGDGMSDQTAGPSDEVLAARERAKAFVNVVFDGDADEASMLFARTLFAESDRGSSWPALATSTTNWSCCCGPTSFRTPMWSARVSIRSWTKATAPSGRS